MTLEFDIKTTIRDNRPGIVARTVSAVAAILAGLSFSRGSATHRSRGSPPVSNHIRRDIGLPPIPEGRSHWDFR